MGGRFALHAGGLPIAKHFFHTEDQARIAHQTKEDAT
jgi:hypothetical protein